MLSSYVDGEVAAGVGGGVVIGMGTGPATPWVAWFPLVHIAYLYWPDHSAWYVSGLHRHLSSGDNVWLAACTFKSNYKLASSQSAVCRVFLVTGFGDFLLHWRVLLWRVWHAHLHMHEWMLTIFRDKTLVLVWPNTRAACVCKLEEQGSWRRFLRQRQRQPARQTDNQR